MIGYDRVLQGIIGKSHTSFRILKAILQLSFYLIHFNQGIQKAQVCCTYSVEQTNCNTYIYIQYTYLQYTVDILTQTTDIQFIQFRERIIGGNQCDNCTIHTTHYTNDDTHDTI